MPRAVKRGVGFLPIGVLLLAPFVLALGRIGALAAAMESGSSRPHPAVVSHSPAAPLSAHGSPAPTADSPIADPVIERYARGEIVEAITLARDSGLPELAAELERLQEAYLIGLEARANRNVQKAIRHLKVAAEIDRRLCASGSELGTRLQRQLSKLHRAGLRPAKSKRPAAG